MFAVCGPHSWFWHKAKKQFLDKIWWVFYYKSKILIILLVRYEKITLFDEFLVLLGPIISSFFCIFKWGKKFTKTIKGARSSPISMIEYSRKCLMYVTLQAVDVQLPRQGPHRRRVRGLQVQPGWKVRKISFSFHCTPSPGSGSTTAV